MSISFGALPADGKIDAPYLENTGIIPYLIELQASITASSKVQTAAISDRILALENQNTNSAGDSAEALKDVSRKLDDLYNLVHIGKAHVAPQSSDSKQGGRPAPLPTRGGNVVNVANGVNG